MPARPQSKIPGGLTPPAPRPKEGPHERCREEGRVPSALGGAATWSGAADGQFPRATAGLIMSRMRLLVVVCVVALALPSVAVARAGNRSYGYNGGYSRPYSGSYSYYYATTPWGRQSAAARSAATARRFSRSTWRRSTPSTRRTATTTAGKLVPEAAESSVAHGDQQAVVCP